MIRGAYSLLQPDNRIRSVEYQVDGHKGFRAVVKYRTPTGKDAVAKILCLYRVTPKFVFNVQFE